MIGHVSSLTEREKEVLRLLAASHDAKSAAAQLGLSVHTINERLRTARRKLGVSSSRAAARVLSEAETGAHQNLVDKEFGEAALPAVVNDVPPAARRPVLSQGWLKGGLLMSVVALTIALMGQTATVSEDGHGAPPPDPVATHTPSSPTATKASAAPVAPLPPARAAPTQTTRTEGSRDAPQDAASHALAWLALVDRGDWNGSWQTASSTFQRRMDQDVWATRAAQLDRPSGPLVRVQQYAARSTPSADADAAGSIIVQYQATSDTGARLLETVALVPDGEAWKVSAYFAHGSPGPVQRPAP